MRRKGEYASLAWKNADEAHHLLNTCLNRQAGLRQ